MPNYGDPSYWDQRYRDQEGITFDWYVSFQSLFRLEDYDAIEPLIDDVLLKMFPD
jgi:hypothetical protein